MSMNNNFDIFRQNIFKNSLFDNVNK